LPSIPLSENVVAFYNKRGTCEQWIKEGKGAIKWTRLSCRTFAANAVRLQLHVLAYNLGNFLRTLATPEPIKDLNRPRGDLNRRSSRLKRIFFEVPPITTDMIILAELLRAALESAYSNDPTGFQRCNARICESGEVFS
jgi:hypothetical protein